MIEQEIQTNENPRFDVIALRHVLTELPTELIYSRPWLLVAKAWVGFTSSQFADAICALLLPHHASQTQQRFAIAVIQTLRKLLNENNPVTENTDQLWGLVTALKGMQARQQGNAAESVTFIEKAL